MGVTVGLQIVIVGVFACFVFDVWQRFFHWFTAIPPSNWAIVGRWAIGLMTNGQLMVRDLDFRPVRRNELSVGWLVHYVIAVVYAAIFMLLIKANILAAGFADGLFFGMISVVVPWFFFLPCLGKGIMGRLTPNPPLVCALALMMHSIFGAAIGLGFSFFAR
ncbi:DUF2938 domain-containing protein [Candidatus Puniceispirillum sp.]|nr:DUF2938 domain-containing protein [Candidatus Puniceispirillum sp.]